MIAAEIRARIEAATVQLPGLGGQGVLVAGNIVLTAAHCIAWDSKGGLALGDHAPHRLVTRGEAAFTVGLLAVEPMNDIAALCGLDDQEFEDDAFDTWCGTVDPVTVRAWDPRPGEKLEAHVLTHDRRWIAATLERFGLHAIGKICITPNVPLEGGTSGGPVVDEDGNLLGIVSNSGDVAGTMPVAYLALPRWVWSRIAEGMSHRSATLMEMVTA